MKTKKWIEDFQSRIQTDAKISKNKGDLDFANFLQNIANDIQAEIDNPENAEIWEE